MAFVQLIGSVTLVVMVQVNAAGWSYPALGIIHVEGTKI
jgi:hypothetical protein